MKQARLSCRNNSQILMTYVNRWPSCSPTCGSYVSRRLCSLSSLERLSLHDGAATILNTARHHHRTGLWRTWMVAKELNALVEKQHVPPLLTTHQWGLVPWWHPATGVRKGNPIMCLEGEPDVSKQHHQVPYWVSDALETTGRKEEKNHNHMSGEEKAWLRFF